MSKIEFFPVHSLVKLLPDGPCPPAFASDTALKNERYTVQLAVYSDTVLRDLAVTASPAAGITVRKADYVPVMLPTLPEGDDFHITKKPGIFPDPLMPVTGLFSLASNAWQSIYITVDCSALNAGSHDFSFNLTSEMLRLSAETTFFLTVLPAELPESDLIYTNWIHYDCISQKHNVKLFSNAFYRVFAHYLDNAVTHGMNMLLVPLFTPPLDTALGGERQTAQLIDVTVDPDGGYVFAFDRLKKFMSFAAKHGIKYFEMSHLFSQWGAKYAPKIMAVHGGAEQRLFPWDESATGENYPLFLDVFLPELTAFLKAHFNGANIFFHLSDEPSPEAFPAYAAANKLIAKHLDGHTLMDALSVPEIYESGLSAMPFVSTEHAELFYKRGHSKLCVYTCCSECVHYSPNRFIAMPNVRNRALGTLLYRNNCPAYLHWGYNFYLTQFSRAEIDPYAVTDSGRTFPAGDPFIVYSYKDGVIDSLRHETFYDGIQDYRLLKLLEHKLGRAAVVNLLDAHGYKAGFSDYPKTDVTLLSLRTEIHKLLTAPPEKN